MTTQQTQALTELRAREEQLAAEIEQLATASAFGRPDSRLADLALERSAVLKQIAELTIVAAARGHEREFMADQA